MATYDVYLRLIEKRAVDFLLVIELFYSSSALLATQSTVIARGIPSVCLCLSVRPSVTFRYCVQTNRDTIVRFSASGRTILLVSEEVKIIRIFAGITPNGGGR